ncbi:hypothetical protein ACFV0H_06375 [Streptomyces erythrochromogenes]|uniref:hypothetical protein n=1 Tax=Streptomyces TaxID=1883 RepID=UPI002F9183CA|nr:hypothetical protein OG605_38855 [Streptomyces xanthophaeus]
MNTTHSTARPASADQGEEPSASRPAGAPYEMRPLSSDADRTAAAALVESRARWLAERGITVPHHHVAAYRDAWAEAVGLYEDNAAGEEILIGCLLLHRQPEPRPGDTDTQGPSLGISLVYTAPDLDDQCGWLITVWAGDFAARTGATRAHAEAPSPAGRDHAADALLRYLRSLGWLVTGTGINRDGHRVARLRLNAQQRDGLAGLINCTVPVDVTRPEPGNGDPR